MVHCSFFKAYFCSLCGAVRPVFSVPACHVPVCHVFGLAVGLGAPPLDLTGSPWEAGEGESPGALKPSGGVRGRRARQRRRRRRLHHSAHGDGLLPDSMTATLLV